MGRFSFWEALTDKESIMNPTVIPYPPNAKVTLTVTKADNLLIGYLAEKPNQHRQIYGRLTDNAVTFKDTIDIENSIVGVTETLTMTGVNFSGGGQISFTIEVNNTVKANVSLNLAQYSSQSWAFTFQRV